MTTPELSPESLKSAIVIVASPGIGRLRAQILASDGPRFSLCRDNLLAPLRGNRETPALVCTRVLICTGETGESQSKSNY